jgi:hypothetical protein
MTRHPILARGPHEAGARGWVAASLKQDWKLVFREPSEKR